MKKIICIFLSFVFFLSFPTKAAFANALTINSNAALLMDAHNGQILFEKNSEDELPLASVTKVMTLLLVFEALDKDHIKLEDSVTISENASSMGGSQVFLETGEKQTVETLIKSIVIASGNDASVAIAEYIAGSEENFVKMMNDKSTELGMVNTNFLDSCGLTDEGHYSSAKDIAIMSKELITMYPDILNYTTIWNDTITHNTARGEEVTELWNTNKMLRSYSDLNGLKTGFTSAAGFCISATATKDGLTLISVILGAENSAERFYEAEMLLNFGYSSYKLAEGLKITEPISTIKISKSNKPEVNVYQKENVSIVVAKDSEAEIKTKVDLVQNLQAPIPNGSKVGQITYYLDNKEVAYNDLIIHETILKANVKDNLKLIMEHWL